MRREVVSEEYSTSWRKLVRVGGRYDGERGRDDES
jgi:hypothetical protein